MGTFKPAYMDTERIELPSFRMQMGVQSERATTAPSARTALGSVGYQRGQRYGRSRWNRSRSGERDGCGNWRRLSRVSPRQAPSSRPLQLFPPPPPFTFLFFQVLSTPFDCLETCGCLSNQPLPSPRCRGSESKPGKEQSKLTPNTNQRVRLPCP